MDVPVVVGLFVFVEIVVFVLFFFVYIVVQVYFVAVQHHDDI
jgi:hypothetical protein